MAILGWRWGLAMLINALLVPILVAVTLIALRFMDRNFWWMQRLAHRKGLADSAADRQPLAIGPFSSGWRAVFWAWLQ